MRRLAAVIFFLLWTLYGTSQNPLDRRITITFSETDVFSALKSISKSENFQFSFNPNIIPSKTIYGRFQMQPIKSVLDTLLGSQFEYKIRGSYVIILKKPLSSDKPVEKKISIKGEILDAETGQRIESASVYDANSLNAALTNQKGTYQLHTNTITKYSVLAISKENYRDTVIFTSNLFIAPLKLVPLKNPTDTLFNDKPSLRFLKFLRNHEAKQHNRNIFLQEKRLAQISLFPVLGSNGLLSGKISNNISLNIVAGYAYSLNGVEIGGALNMERMEMEGVQLAGMSNIVGEKGKGVQIAGLSNSNLKSMKGVQIAGVINSAESIKGVQISGAINFSKEKMEGLQLSGVLNKAEELIGLQLGVVNLTKSTKKGLMIGLINIAGDGFHKFGVEHNDLTPINLNFKSGLDKLYTILSAGINPIDRNLWTYGIGFGTRIKTQSQWIFSMEATSNTVQSLSGFIDDLSIDNRFDLGFGHSIFKGSFIKGGPSLHYYLLNTSNTEYHSFYEKVINGELPAGKNNKIWLGYHVNVSF